jgi:hypothetical protein
MDPAGGYGWRAGARRGRTPYSLAGRAERVERPREPLCVLLLPQRLEDFALRDQAEDLLTGPGVVAVEPARLSYGAVLRLPEAISDGIAAVQARRLHLPGEPRAVAIFHPLQYPLARSLLAQHPDAELWYGRWNRVEVAHDASPRRRRRLERLHEQAAARATLEFAASEALARLEREAGREPVLTPPAADSFPAPDPAAATVAVALAEPGLRTDWPLLRAVAEGMPELALLLAGEWDEGGEDLRSAPNVVWLGERSDAEAARMILCADVGLLPLERSAAADAALPQRVLEYARLGRRTIAPELAGVRTWERAVTFADGADAWIEALRASAGARARPDAELRAWALARTAHHHNRPLWERMESLGIASGRLGSERPEITGGARTL